ncbi:putative exosome complex exonuclease rrp43 protein [Phaeoacremonium minimum UCRPA7]|uniref:Ribosomal RNA-processing protein 43 n=1 Tax=Phaeoacremonium minimum (strain UCR-PA7) TaxID=1286976 RepID=R8BQN0_PHAM7|nr:putative exosome complex exonuclease rrp43 protein [Phaeoacremonium minimum UCRPA7]EOO01657.1 putative exosome complex exonuclease rrp43 protein [Phaeoacremonium minimum UCRPA7]
MRVTCAPLLNSADVRREGAKELKDYDLLVPNVELATGSAPEFLPGVPPTTLAQTLSTKVFSLLHTSRLVDAQDLRIWYKQPSLQEDDRMDEDGNDDEDADDEQSELKAYWTLYIDVLFISFDGNPFDAAWAAIVAALRDTKLPRAWWDADREIVICSRSEEMPLNISGLPVACSAAIFTEKEAEKASQGKHWVLVDPDRLEESLCDEVITMVVDKSGGQTRIRNLSKSGGTIIGPQLLRDFTNLAGARWEEFRKAIQ